MIPNMLMNLFWYHVNLSSNYINCLVPNRCYFQMQLVIPSHLNTCEEIFQNIKNIKNRLSKESRIVDDSILIANFSLTYMFWRLLDLSFLLIYRKLDGIYQHFIPIYHPLLSWDSKRDVYKAFTYTNIGDSMLFSSTAIIM